MKRLFFLILVVAMVACKDQDAPAKETAVPAVEKTSQNAADMKKDKAKKSNKPAAVKSTVSDDKMWRTIQSKVKLNDEQVAELKNIENNRKQSLRGEKDKKKRQDINKQARKSELKLLGKDLYKEYRAIKSQL